MRSLGVVCAVLVGCNSLTGADMFLVVDDDSTVEERSRPESPDAEEPAETTAPETGTTPEPDSGIEPETGPPDLDSGSDSPPVTCTPRAIGPRYPRTIGGNWYQPQNAKAPDGRAAHSNSGSLIAEAYDFDIPETSRVTGIRVVISRSKDKGTVSDTAVRLPKGSSKNNGPWPSGHVDGPHTETTYGGENDLWGTTWTPAEINDPSFGVSLTANVSSGGDGHVDFVSVTTYVCP